MRNIGIESDGVNVEVVINVYWWGSFWKMEKVINVVIMGFRYGCFNGWFWCR